MSPLSNFGVRSFYPHFGHNLQGTMERARPKRKEKKEAFVSLSISKAAPPTSLTMLGKPGVLLSFLPQKAAVSIGTSPLIEFSIEGWVPHTPTDTQGRPTLSFPDTKVHNISHRGLRGQPVLPSMVRGYVYHVSTKKRKNNSEREKKLLKKSLIYTVCIIVGSGGFGPTWRRAHFLSGSDQGPLVKTPSLALGALPSCGPLLAHREIYYSSPNTRQHLALPCQLAQPWPAPLRVHSLAHL